jgi:hypothetical protein
MTGLRLTAEQRRMIVATALHCVNAVPYAVAARPGLLTYLDLPPVAGRAAADLHRGRRDDDPGDRPGPRSKRLAGAYSPPMAPRTSPTGQTRSNQETPTMNPREMRLGCLHRSQSPANETIWMAPAGRSRGQNRSSHNSRRLLGPAGPAS